MAKGQQRLVQLCTLRAPPFKGVLAVISRIRSQRVLAFWQRPFTVGVAIDGDFAWVGGGGVGGAIGVGVSKALWLG